MRPFPNKPKWPTEIIKEHLCITARCRLQTFSEDYIAIANKNTNGNPRLFLRHLRDRLNEFKDRGHLYKLTASDIDTEVKEKAVAVAGVPPMTPDKIVTPSELSEVSIAKEEITKPMIDLMPGEIDALSELFSDLEKPVSKPTPSVITTSTFVEPSETPSISPAKVSTSSEIIDFLEKKWAQYAREFEQEIFAFPHPSDS